MQKTLIVFGTRKGASEETAEVIATILRDKYSLSVDVFDAKKDLKKKKVTLDLTQYQAIIIGSSIAIGRWTNEAKNFLKNNLTDKDVFVFVCSGRAGTALTEGDLEQYKAVQKKYIDDVLEKYPHVTPVATKAFGGWYKYMNWNRENVVAWAEEIGNQIAS